MKKLHHLLVGIDFSPASGFAFREAARWAAFDAADVTVLHIIAEDAAEAMCKALGLDEAKLRQHVTVRLNAFLAEWNPEAARVNVQVGIGHPFAKLADACKRSRPDFLVLGSNGTRHSPDQVGVIAAKCIRQAPADVLLVKANITGRNGTDPFERVVACVDFSGTSGRAVSCARDLALRDHAKLDCLFVYQSAMELVMDYGGTLPSAFPADPEGMARWKIDLDRFVDPILGNEKPEGSRNVVVEGLKIRDAIVTHIRDTEADLVVLGTRGKTDLRTLIMGTTAEKIIKSVPCSVLAVKPDGFEYMH